MGRNSSGGDNFAVLRAERDRKPALIVVDQGLDPERDSRRYPSLLTIRLPIRLPGTDGLCTQEESERLNQVEDSLLEALDPNDFRYVGHVTWNGSRDILIYVRDPHASVSKLHAPAGRLGLAPIEIAEQEDPDWEEYSQFRIA
jgi:Family of unknown function (DUF695)